MKRYEPVRVTDNWTGMVESEDGAWVLYAEAVQAIALATAAEQETAKTVQQLAQDVRSALHPKPCSECGYCTGNHAVDCPAR